MLDPDAGLQYQTDSPPDMGEWHKASTAQLSFPDCPGFSTSQR